MRIIIVGGGKVGYTLIEMLSKEGHDITVIDSDRGVLERSLEELDVMVLYGNGTDLKVLRQAGIAEADLLIAVTFQDEVNLFCCMLAKKLGCKHTIARVRNPEYEEAVHLLNDELGLSLVFNPEYETAFEIARLIRFPSFLQMDAFARGRVQIVELEVHENDKLDHVFLQDLYKFVKAKVLICAVQRNEETYIPTGTFQLLAGDKIFVTASVQELTKLIHSLKLGMRKIRSALLVGGSRIADYLTQMLLDSGVHVKIIESDRQRCEILSGRYGKAKIIHADGTVKKVLMEAGISESDVVVSLTNIDEENILISMLANFLHVPKSITKINRMEYSELFRDRGIDSVISPRYLATHNIIRYVRAIQNTSGGGDMITLHRIANDQVEALEFQTDEHTLHLNEKLSRISLKPNILLACITHKSKIIIPNGNDSFALGDTVLVVTLANITLHGLNEIFEENDTSLLANQQLLMDVSQQDS